MNQKNEIHRPFIIILLTITILFFLTWAKSNFSLAGFSFKQVNILSDVTKKASPAFVPKAIPKEKIKLTQKEQKLFKAGKLNKDSLMQVLQKDERISDFRTDSLDILGRFFNKLAQVEQGKNRVRIGWFGDSMIEGDFITQTVRTILQNQFGGKGVGFVTLLSPVAGFRQTIGQTSSSNWQTYTVLKPRKGYLPGISGQVNIPVSTATSPSPWAAFTPGTADGKSTFQTMKLYYGRSRKKSLLTYFLDGKQFTDSLKGRSLVNELTLNAQPGLHQLKTVFKGDSLTVFGISDESENGVLLDNLSLRGNSGTPLQVIPEQVLKQFNNYLKYDLLVLQYGTNVVAGTDTNMDWYERGMVKVINRLKRNFPQADILLISVGDKSYKEDMQFVTQPNIPILVETQRRIAKETGVAFWNLFQAMGGPNSMAKWVESPTPLANKDYTHVNARGAAKLGKIISNNLLNEYQLYKENRR
jgi:lysophospholipase L1-like esterase